MHRDDFIGFRPPSFHPTVTMMSVVASHPTLLGKGTAMPESQSRRLTAILAADIAGYSALMGADEARTVRDRLARCRVVSFLVMRKIDALICIFRGPFDKSSDSALSLFGWQRRIEKPADLADRLILDLQ